MTFQHWLGLAQFVTMCVAGFLLWTVRSAFKSGKWANDLESRVINLEKRMDKAGGEMSNLATAVQGLIERARTIFVTQREFDDFSHECRQDRRSLWQALGRRRADRE